MRTDRRREAVVGNERQVDWIRQKSFKCELPDAKRLLKYSLTVRDYNL
jgi:hypothetical protein